MSESDGEGSVMKMNDAKCLAMQWIAAKKSREELNRHIKKVERDLLETPEITDLKLLLSNEGGQKTHDGITIESKRDHVWDQARLAQILTELPPENRPEFITETTTFKVDYRAFQTYAMGNPSDPMVQALHGAHSIKLGDSKIKTINEEKLEEAQ